MVDEASSVIRRYQVCVQRILRLFDGDPLPEDDPANSCVERLESILERGLLRAEFWAVKPFAASGWAVKPFAASGLKLDLAHLTRRMDKWDEDQQRVWRNFEIKVRETNKREAEDSWREEAVRLEKKIDDIWERVRVDLRQIDDRQTAK